MTSICLFYLFFTYSSCDINMTALPILLSYDSPLSGGQVYSEHVYRGRGSLSWHNVPRFDIPASLIFF